MSQVSEIVVRWTPETSGRVASAQIQSRIVGTAEWSEQAAAHDPAAGMFRFMSNAPGADVEVRLRYRMTTGVFSTWVAANVHTSNVSVLYPEIEGTPSKLADVNPVEGAKLDGIAVGADKTEFAFQVLTGRSAPQVVSDLDSAIGSVALASLQAATYRGETDQLVYDANGVPTRTIIEGLGATLGDHSAYISDLRSVSANGTAKAMLAVRGDGGLVGWQAMSGPGNVNQLSFVASQFLFVDDNGGNPKNALVYDGGKWKLKDIEADTITYGSLVPKFSGGYQSLDPSGWYQELPGGMVMQGGRFRGTISNESSFSIVFPKPFPTAILSVNATAFIAATSNVRDLWMQNLGEPSLRGATFFTQAARRDDQRIDGFDWMAFGR